MTTSNLPNTRYSSADKRAKAFNIIGSRTLAAAQVSKLREGNAPHHRKDAGSALVSSTSQSDMMRIAQEQQIRLTDSENAMEIMPEIEWACRVLVSSILSPKDMTKRELTYNIDIDWIPPGAKTAILEEVKKSMEEVYGYADSLYHIFKDALFTKGGHPRLVLPEAAVDRIINSGETLTMESLRSNFGDDEVLKNIGFFGPIQKDGPSATRLTMESFTRANDFKGSSSADEKFYVTYKDGGGKDVTETLEHLTVSDNYTSLKLASYMQAVAASARSKMIPGIDMDPSAFDFADTDSSSDSITATSEAFNNPPTGKHSGLTEAEFRSTIYKSAPNNLVTHLKIPGRSALTRRSVGRPLVLSLPMESVIPIHAPGDVRRHLGYVLLIDETGHPISMHAGDQVFRQAQVAYSSMMSSSPTAGGNAVGSSILSKAARNLGSNSEVTTFRDMAKIFEQLVEGNIVPRLMNGAFPEGVAISGSDEVFTLMLARTLCSMRTRMVFVPAESLTYFAFDYHHNGMGKSLLDANKRLISIRAGLLLTRMTGELRNSIPLTKVNMKIDEDDADWEQTWADAYDAVTKTRQPQYPLNTLAVNDIMDWVHRAGFIFTFEGHPRMPDTSFDFEKINHENPLPDQDFYESLGKQLYMGFGIPPELMDSTYDSDFAISVASRNIMFTQAILEYQKIASALISEDHHRLILSDGIMMNSIVGVVKSKWGEIASKIPEEDRGQMKTNPAKFAMQLVSRIVSSIRVSLPSPDSTTLENQRTEFDKFSQFVDTLMPYFIGDEIISADIAPELAQKFSSLAPTIKAAFIRDYLSKNNVMPEMFKMSSIGENGLPAFDLLNLTEDHTKGLLANIMSFAKSIIPVDAAAVKDSETLKLGSEGSSSLGGGGGGGGDMGGGMGEEGGGDEFGMNDLETFEIPGEGETPAETTPPEEGNEPPATV